LNAEHLHHAVWKEFLALSALPPTELEKGDPKARLERATLMCARGCLLSNGQEPGILDTYAQFLVLGKRFDDARTVILNASHPAAFEESIALLERATALE
jgi:hypothetical protein